MEKTIKDRIENKSALLSVASYMELFTSKEDWEDWFKQVKPEVHEEFIAFTFEGKRVRLYPSTMVLVTGRNDLSTMRHLLDYEQSNNVIKACYRYTYNKQNGEMENAIYER